MIAIFRYATVPLFFAGALLAQEQAPAPKTYPQPALLTSCGQSADVLILRGLCGRAGVNAHYRPQATADSLGDVKTVILVAGASSKGLGAAKADPKAEETRVKKLIAAARKAKLPVIVFHVGGEARRGVLSDPFSKIAAEGGETIVVVKGGDEDGFFKKIAAGNKARYVPIEKSADVVPVLTELFGKPKGAKP